LHKGILQNKLFYCGHIDGSQNELQDISEFTVRTQNGYGLVNYLQKFAWQDEVEGMMRTYTVRDFHSSELAGYFSLKAGLISINETTTENGVTFDTIPGIEIANFAVNYGYLEKHSELEGVGLIIFNDFIIPIIQDIAKSVGVKIVYIFALPFKGLIDHYRKYGFSRLDSASEYELHKRLKPRYDETCVFMFQTLS